MCVCVCVYMQQLTSLCPSEFTFMCVCARLCVLFHYVYAYLPSFCLCVHYVLIHVLLCATIQHDCVYLSPAAGSSTASLAPGFLLLKVERLSFK